MADHPFLNRIRTFNKHILNRVFRLFAGKSHTFFVLIRHVGRRSGKPYETPIIAVPSEDGFVVALTYGPDVDWYRNVVAAGRCTMLWHGKEFVLGAPQPVDPQIAVSAFPRILRPILKLNGTLDFVQMAAQAVPV